jgi:carbon-monoxide dehydrogenase large subunit
MSATETTRFVGAPVKRKEDGPLQRGRGTNGDNIDLPGTVAMVVVRSPYAHARTRERRRGRCAPRHVVAVFHGTDLRDDWKAPMPCAWPVTEEMKNPPHYPLADTEVNYQGDGVAVVLADSRAHAIDAAELVEVEYEPLPVAIEVAAAAEDGAPLVHDELGTNVSYVWKLETDAFDAASPPGTWS